jgi:predicted CoA-substrate-specific enzyme activase
MKVGIDVGSTSIKIVFVESDRIVWKKVVPTKPGQSAVVEHLVELGMNACSILKTDIEKTSVTGYGRNLICGDNHVVDEIWANAAGIQRLTNGRAGTLINIGGQDIKVISVSETGQVLDYRMNDKCAAGTGRFFEMAANILDTPLEDFHVSDPVADKTVNINATCAVFAESEIVSLLAKGIDKHSIIRGINQAVARRVASLAGNGMLEEEIYVDGGPARNRGLVDCLADQLLCDIKVAGAPQFTVAFGSLFVE